MTQKFAKNLCAPSHKFVGLYLRIRNLGIYRQSKNLLNSNISSTRPHTMVNYGLLVAETGWRVWGTRANCNGFLVLASLLYRRHSTEVNQTLHDVWLSPGPLRTEVCLGPDDTVLDGDPVFPQKGHSPQFSAHVYCGQTVAHLSYC